MTFSTLCNSVGPTHHVQHGSERVVKLEVVVQTRGSTLRAKSF